MRVPHPAGRRALLLAALVGSCALMALFPTWAAARTLTVTLSFERPVVEPVAAAPDEVVLVMPGCTSWGTTGLPFLPARGLVLALPPGEEITAVRSEVLAEHPVPGTHRILTTPAPQPVGATGPLPPTSPDQTVYASDEPFPAEPARVVTVESAWGHALAFLRIVPVSYRPASGRLSWCGTLRIEVDTAPVARPAPTAAAGPTSRSASPSHLLAQMASSANLRADPVVRDYLRKLVANPCELPLYDALVPAAPGSGRLDPGDFAYVVITTAEMEPCFRQVVQFHSSRGLRACTVLLSEILATYGGRDEAEQLRNFIIDAYQTWGVSYVLLGGDADLIPIRRLYGLIQGFDGRFPGECYYEGLDGTWNDDGDELWGEWGEWDLVGEVAVGRACVATSEEFDRWWHKTVMATEHPVVDEIEKGLFLGEQLDANTWGGHYMDEVKDYTATHGYETSGYPETYVKETLYDLHFVWDKWDLIPLLNSGFPTTHHLGHSAWNHVMKMDSEDIVHLTNDGATHSYMINYSQGCHPNMFHYTGDDDAIAEKLVYDEHGSAAFIGNTSYGWFFPGVTSGPSQHYERQFVDACYGEGIVQIGWMNVDSKVDNIWMLTDWLQWCHYELCVTGDPALPQWRRLEGQLEVTHAGTHVIGQDTYEVTVFAAGAPVENASVTVYSGDLEQWSSAATDAMGLAVLPMTIQDPMTLHLKAVKPDHLPAADSLVAAPAAGPWLRLAVVAFDDDGMPPSMGDGDGLADAGETLELRLTLENIGPAPAENAAVALDSADPRLAVIDGEAIYGTIAAGGTAENGDDLLVRVTPAAGDLEIAHLSLDMSCDGPSVWNTTFGMHLHAPVLSLAAWELDDTATGDGEGDMDPGETFALRVTLANAGSDEARDVAALLGSASTYVDIHDPASGMPLIPIGGQETLVPDFGATLSPLTPTDIEIEFDLAATTWAEQTTQITFAVPVASFFEDDFEQENGWTAGVPGDDATGGVWVRVDPIGTWGSGIPVQPEDDHSPLGTHCFVTGQGEQGGSAMASDVDGGRTTLLSPALDLTAATEPRLIYWRWWTNNYGPFAGEDVWQVEISDDGGASWVFLENTYDGINEWVRLEFALEDYIDLTSNVCIRFIARDDQHDSLIEAAVDDVSIESSPGTAGIGPEGAGGPGVGRPGAVTTAFGIHAVAPGVLLAGRGSAAGAGALAIRYALPEAGEAILQVFAVDGALVATLAAGPHAAGEHRASWSGRGPAGAPAGSGVYWIRLAAGGRTDARRVIAVR